MHHHSTPSRAQISRSAIQRLHISMRHLFLRGSYKPLGVSGETMMQSLLELEPEIYGQLRNEERVDLKGLLYIFQRLPVGIEQCRYIRLIAREGFEKSGFDPIVPSKRRRNCYRIDEEQMYIEMTRGRSDIYDVLTHLTFLYIESEKIRKHALDAKDRHNRAWLMLGEIVKDIEQDKEVNRAVGYTYLSSLLGRTYEEIAEAAGSFAEAKQVNNLFSIVYYMGQLSMDEFFNGVDREISFSSVLREKLGHHTYGEQWAQNVKAHLDQAGLLDREIHIISANLHSVMNTIYAKQAVGHLIKGSDDLLDIAEHLSQSENKGQRAKVKEYAKKHGLIEVSDDSGTNITVQIIDLAEVVDITEDDDKVIVVMDYAFGEQAYETMDELLKPYEKGSARISLDVKSINVMGKAGILTGGKGDIMIPSSHVFEGSADNYPVANCLSMEEFKGYGLDICEGSMITVLGTSLQNKDILRYFKESSWGAVGLEMEGAHYQKAIQAASKIRHSIDPDVELRYAYYASDNPLETGSTLASGSLGLDGVLPTYAITFQILNGILKSYDKNKNVN